MINNSNMNQQLVEEQKSEMPLWLQLLLLIGGTVLAGYLIGRLLEMLFEGEDSGRVPRVFISHSWKYDRDYWSLMDKFERNDFNFYNHSIDVGKPLDVKTSREIEEGIRSKMKGCSKVLVLAGPYSQRYWIKKEVEIANQLNKEVIAVRPWGQTFVPKYLESKADRIVGFNSIAIMENLKYN